MPPGTHRVVSLLPSATEMVCALGAADDLIGISHECDFPESIRDRQVLTGPRVADRGSSGAIDAEVRSLVADALSIYEVDEKKLAELRPDLIITQDLCEVCAVSLRDVRSALARLAGRESIEILSLHPTRLGDVLADLERVGAALGLAQRAKLLRSQLQARIDAISGRARDAGARPRVLSVEWLDPLMLGGTWMPELIELAGGEAVGAEAGALAKTLSSGDLAKLEPDVVIVKPCGFDVERALCERALIEAAIFSPLPPQTRIIVSDGNAFFNRPGPRIVESLEILAACIHPELFADLGHQHAAVIRPFP